MVKNAYYSSELHGLYETFDLRDLTLEEGPSSGGIGSPTRFPIGIAYLGRADAIVSGDPHLGGCRTYGCIDVDGSALLRCLSAQSPLVGSVPGL
jgi:hypothetical protein